jgi:hypothetical protein
MQMTAIKRLCFAVLPAAILLLAACDHNPKEWKTPNMTALTPRLQSLFERTKTVCFGRFMVEVPVSATVAWGGADIPLGVRIYSNGADEVKTSAQKFINELKSEKAINHNDAPLLLSVEDIAHPEGKIVTGYEDFQAINGLKITGYFRLVHDGVVIDARPLRAEKDSTTADIKSIARRLRQRAENEVPTEPGNCIENAFLPDSPDDDKDHPGELISIGFRLKEFPDAHLSISVAPSNPHNPEGDSLQAQWKRIKEDPATPEEKKALASIKYFRESPRQIHDWKTGYEVLVRNPDEKGVHSYHDFQIKFTGVPHDPFRPYADIQFQTGVGDNAAGAVKASLTDEEAIAVWDKITSTIRVRPTSTTADKTAGTDHRPNFLLGELAATGRVCPQTGWWEPDEQGKIESSRRQHIKAGDRMPHVVSVGEPSLWQKLKGEQPSYRTATVWKLVAYGDPPALADVPTHSPPIAHVAPSDAAARGIADSETKDSGNDKTSTNTKG